MQSFVSYFKKSKSFFLTWKSWFLQPNIPKLQTDCVFLINKNQLLHCKHVTPKFHRSQRSNSDEEQIWHMNCSHSYFVLGQVNILVSVN